jgi:hypothetical protein
VLTALAGRAYNRSVMNAFLNQHCRIFACCVPLLVFHLGAVCGCSETARSNRPGEQGAETTRPWESDVPFHAWKYVVIHHTATDSGSVESIDQTHRDVNQWQGIGYHFLIGNGNGMEDGQVEATFRWQEQLPGAHAGVGPYNEYGIGICLVGNFEVDEPTPAQIDAVSRLVAGLKAEFGLSDGQILRHKDLKPTACPGQNFPFERVAAVPAETVPAGAVPAGAGLGRTETAGMDQPVEAGVATRDDSHRFTGVKPGNKEEVRNVAAIARSRMVRNRVRSDDGQ